MKLDCSVVEDLYPLYIENEIKLSTRQAIKDHLASCPHCSKVYEEGAGFEEEIGKDNSLKEEVPNSLDEKIRMKIRLFRMQVIAGGLALVIAVSLITNYMNNRERIAENFNDLYLYSEELTFLGKNPQDAQGYSAFLQYSQEKITDFTENLNWLEKRKLNDSWLIVDIGGLEKMASTLVEREKQGLSDEADEAALGELRTNLDNLHKEVQAQYQLFHHGYSSYFEQVDVSKFSEQIARINKTVYFYNRHHMPSAQAELLTEGELKKRIRDVLSIADGKIKLTKRRDQAVTYTFKIEKDGFSTRGEIDGYTGFILESSSHREPEQEKSDSLDYNRLEQEARDFLARQYGKHTEFKLSHKEGFNGIEDMVYFNFIPVVNGYEFYFQYDLINIIGLSMETGEVIEIQANSIPLGQEFFTFRPVEEISKIEAEQIAEEEVSEPVNYASTKVIYSPLAGGYVLAHIFEGKGIEVFIDAKSGRVVDTYYM